MLGDPSTKHGGPIIHFRKTKRGGQMLCRSGVNYVLKRTNKDGSELWRCTNKDSSKCNATIKIKQNPLSILHETTHTHPPREEAEIEIEKQIYLCTETVKKNINKPVTQIFEDTIQNLSDQGVNLVHPLPKFNNVKNKLYRQRNSSLGAKKLNFRKARDFEVPKKFENFIICRIQTQKQALSISFCVYTTVNKQV
ncbi:hypothetical protein HF086_009001 [Spodoptera exigua]|uniref:FLYWCH-type domain-containing protein n=1 Tax=Spodoptera exigua TaxID=7107 RepID=A0A922M3W5_SPOEX|nr:hypothetical protein HF086_009001 [Spodoptera exigua]